MLAPVLPEIGERTGTGPGVAGALVASFAVGQLVGFPLAGLLTHRRSILLAGVARERIVTAWVVWSQLWAVGYLVGPAVAGLVAEAWGYSVLGVVPLAGSLAVAWALQRKQEEQEADRRQQGG